MSARRDSSQARNDRLRFRMTSLSSGQQEPTAEDERQRAVAAQAQDFDVLELVEAFGVDAVLQVRIGRADRTSDQQYVVLFVADQPLADTGTELECRMQPQTRVGGVDALTRDS